MAQSSKRSTTVPSAAPKSLAHKALLLAILACWAFVAASLIGFNPADPPTHLVWPANDPVANWCGPFGAFVSYHLLKLLGFGAWVLTALAGLGLLSSAAGSSLRHPFVRLLGLVMLTASCSGLQHLLFRSSGPLADLAGGLVGTVGVAELSQRFGPMGSFLWLSVMGLLGAVVAMDEWLSAAFGWMWRWTRSRGVPAVAAAGRVTGGLAGEAAVAVGRGTGHAGRGLFAALGAMLRGREPVTVRVNDIDDDDSLPLAEPKRSPRRGKAPEIPTVLDEDEDEIDEEEESAASAAELPSEESTIVETKPSARGKVARAVEEEDEGNEPEDADEPEASPTAPQALDRKSLEEKIKKLPIVFGGKEKTVATQADLSSLQNAENDETKPYQFPSLDLLAEPEANFSAKLEATVREQAAALLNALREYNIDGEVESVESGPVITLFHVRLAPGTKVSALSAVSSDIARTLKAINIRIVSNMVGRDTVGIEVPNIEKEKVRLKELMSKSEKFAGMRLPMFLGKDASGEPLIADLTRMPHMLIAGTTGSGKSVCMNTIIMSFLYTKKPNELKLVLVDPKMVEMSQFKDIPHLMCPVVTEMGKAAAILEWACTKMDERYELLAEAGCRDITTYNELTFEELKERFGVKTPEEEARIPRKLPYMVFIIDELADLMMTAKEVESHIIRIAQKARAVGIHLILATQRPQANVVTGLIKSNMPCRVSFKVASGMDSRIVLDQKGGELLLGHGDMLFLTPSTSKLCRAQGTLVDDKEIRSVVKFMREVAGPSFTHELMTLRSGGEIAPTDEERLAASQNNSSASLAAAQEDPMFPRAVEIVLETKRGSVSLLQRRLAIGYTRASRLIDLMGIAGIISDHKGSVARDVLITPADWEEMKKIAASHGSGLFDSVAMETTGEASAGQDATESAPFETDAERRQAATTKASSSDDEDL